MTSQEIKTIFFFLILKFTRNGILIRLNFEFQISRVKYPLSVDLKGKFAAFSWLNNEKKFIPNNFLVLLLSTIKSGQKKKIYAFGEVIK